MKSVHGPETCILVTWGITVNADDISLVTMHHMWQYQQESAPAHYAWYVHILMGNKFTDLWIGHGRTNILAFLDIMH
jgi:hypothetical protein